MDAQKAKRFSLIDAIVLVAATAAGFAVGRAVHPIDRGYGGFTRDAVADYAVSLSLMWALAVLALNLTRYRATRRELACRPGFTAVVGIVIERLADLLYYAVIFPLEDAFLRRVSFFDLPVFLSELLYLSITNVVRGSSSAGVVAAVWIVTALAGCWRAEKTWLDRTGRALGVFWLLCSAAYWLSVWTFPDQRPPVPQPLLPTAGAPFDLPP